MRQSDPTKESAVDPFAGMPSGKTFIEEAREFALALDPDIGPLFGRDIVRLLDALLAERDVLREALDSLTMVEGKVGKIARAALERPE